MPRAHSARTRTQSTLPSVHGAAGGVQTSEGSLHGLVRVGRDVTRVTTPAPAQATRKALGTKGVRQKKAALEASQTPAATPAEPSAAPAASATPAVAQAAVSKPAS